MFDGERPVRAEGVEVPTILTFNQQDDRFAGWIFSCKTVDRN